MLAGPELAGLLVVAVGAGVDRRELDSGDVLLGGVSSAVTVTAGDVVLVVLAQLPVGDDFRSDLEMAVDAFVCRESGHRQSEESQNQKG